MVDPDLLKILVCPETGDSVAPAGDELLARVNRAISEGKARTRGGESVSGSLHEALVRADGKLLYPVRDGIPIMLLDEAILLDTTP